MYTLSKIIKSAMIVMGVMAMTSCSDNIGKLAGSWVSGETRLQLDQANLADCRTTSRLVFTPDASDRHTGNIAIATDIVIDDALPPTDSVTAPYEITVVGQASIAGTYHWADDEDDEILISLDPATLQVSIDPKGVEFVADVLNGSESPVVVDIDRTALARNYASQVRRAIHVLYDKYVKIEDMKFEKTIMSCEIDNQDYVFRRVDSSQK